MVMPVLVASCCLHIGDRVGGSVGSNGGGNGAFEIVEGEHSGPAFSWVTDGFGRIAYGRVRDGEWR